MKIIETDKTKHDSLIDSMKMFKNAEFSPYVGIFWYDTDKNELFGVYKTMVSALEFDRNGRKTYPILHKDIWNKEANKAKYRNKPTKFKGDYTVIPRGSIFQYKDGHFEVMVGNWINSHDIKDAVIDEFDLPENNTEFIIDEHWDIGHGWSDELF